MKEKDLKETLASICQMLRDEIQYSLNVNTLMMALAKAILEHDTELSRSYEQHWRQLAVGPTASEKPATHAHLQQLDALIQRLRG